MVKKNNNHLCYYFDFFLLQEVLRQSNVITKNGNVVFDNQFFLNTDNRWPNSEYHYGIYGGEINVFIIIVLFVFVLFFVIIVFTIIWLCCF